jgi:hypothetical protein
MHILDSKMPIQKYPLSPPSLEELAQTLRAPLAANYEESAVSVVDCPDLRQAPFHLASRGLSGDEKIADVGGQPNLFPRPNLESKWSMVSIGTSMDMSADKGCLIGAGAGPFHVLGQNSELAPNLSWKDGTVTNDSRFIKIDSATNAVVVDKSPSVDCGLMVNLFGSLGEPGPVLKITARKRKGQEKSFSECVRKGLHAAYGDSRTVSLGGVFVVKSGKALYHVMPDFPSQPFNGRKDVDNWLTFHDFDGPIVCLSVLHSADHGNEMGLRIEHTHCFSVAGENAGGHYHYDLDDTAKTVEYEAYFNTAKMIYRIDRATAA